MDYDKVEELNPEEKATFEQMRKIIMKDYGVKECDSEQIYRFLKARDFDLIQSDKMLRNHIEWRKGANKMAENFKLSKLHERNVRVFGTTYTKEGLPVAYVDVGNLDFKGLTKCIKSDEIINGLICDVIEAEKDFDIQTKKLGKIINQWSIIMDFENFSISQVLYKPNIETFLRIFSIYEANFPERLKTAYIINAAAVFMIIFNIIKPILTAHTLSKVKIFGKDGWQQELLNDINAEDLPMFLGGTKVGADSSPYCGVIKPEGLIPKHNYFRSPQRRLRGKKDVREYVLKRNETHEVVIRVTEMKSKIIWSFETERGDISFGLFYKERDITTKTLLPITTVNAHMELEEGSFVCEETGTYIFLFDNTHSWLREKHVFCKILIKTPDDEEMVITY